VNIVLPQPAYPTVGWGMAADATGLCRPQGGFVMNDFVVNPTVPRWAPTRRVRVLVLAVGMVLGCLGLAPGAHAQSSTVSVAVRVTGVIPTGVSGAVVTITCKNLLGGGTAAFVLPLPFGSAAAPTFWQLTGPTTNPPNPGTSCIVSARPNGTANLTMGTISISIGGVDRKVAVSAVAATGSSPAATLATAEEIPIFSGTDVVVTVAYPDSGQVRYTPITPVRVIDSRIGLGVFAHQLVAGETVPIQISRFNVVSDTATAALLNVTVAGTSGSGFVTVFPCDAVRPNTSNLNFVPGQTVPNLVSVRLSPVGQACVYVSAPTFLIVDISGYYASVGEGYTSLPPARILDSRNGIGGLARPAAAGEVVLLQVAGAGGVAPGSSGAVLNVTVTQPSADGFVTVFPCDSARPVASNLNFVTGQTVANLVYSRLDAAGRVCLFASASTHLIADVNGRFGAGFTFQPLTPIRLVDTRTGLGTFAAKVPAGATLVVNIRGSGGVGGAVSAAVLNVTVTNPDSPGYITVFPCDVSLPNASNLNFSAGQTVPNLVNARVSVSGGQVCVFTTARTDLIVDLNGYFLA
jgi:hypothetical protein